MGWFLKKEFDKTKKNAWMIKINLMFKCYYKHKKIEYNAKTMMIFQSKKNIWQYNAKNEMIFECAIFK